MFKEENKLLPYQGLHSPLTVILASTTTIVPPNTISPPTQNIVWNCAEIWQSCFVKLRWWWVERVKWLGRGRVSPFTTFTISFQQLFQPVQNLYCTALNFVSYLQNICSLHLSVSAMHISFTYFILFLHSEFYSFITLILIIFFLSFCPFYFRYYFIFIFSFDLFLQHNFTLWVSFCVVLVWCISVLLHCSTNLLLQHGKFSQALFTDKNVLNLVWAEILLTKMTQD